MKLFFVINGLQLGGAERMLVKLLSTDVFTRDEVTVVALQPPGELTDELIAKGHEVIHLNVSKSVGGLMKLARLPILVKQRQPDIIHSWLYMSDLASGICALLTGMRPVIWSIRQTDISLAQNRFTTVACAKLCAWCSHYLPHTIITNASASRLSHASFGYDEKRICVIPNGIDHGPFLPEQKAGMKIRDELGIPDDAAVVGMVARFDSQKNHTAFFDAARQLAERLPELHFVLCGKDMVLNNPHLKVFIEDSIAASNIHLLGQRRDVASIMNALDLFMLSSSGEGWPNVVGEAMACGVPCVVTNVGDVAQIVGDAGFLVPNGNSSALAEEAFGFLTCSEGQRHLMSKAARQRVKRLFDIRVIAGKYRSVYEAALQSKGGQL